MVKTILLISRIVSCIHSSVNEFTLLVHLHGYCLFFAVTVPNLTHITGWEQCPWGTRGSALLNGRTAAHVYGILKKAHSLQISSLAAQGFQPFGDRPTPITSRLPPPPNLRVPTLLQPHPSAVCQNGHFFLRGESLIAP